MTMVYSAAEVIRGDFPQSLRTIERVRERILRLLNHPGIVGAIVGGSVAQGTHTLASDIDGLVILADEEAKAPLGEMYSMAKSYHVPLDLAIVREGVARSTLHPLTSGYVRALSLSGPEAVVKANPAEIICQFACTPLQEAILYTGRKLGKFEQWRAGLMLIDAEHQLYLSEILDTPFHVARRVLDVQGVSDTASTPAVIENYRRISAPAAAQLEALREIKQNYALSLRYHLSFESGDRTTTYSRVLHQIQAKGDVSYRFCYVAAEYLTSL